MNDPQLEVVVVMPVYNEEGCIERVLNDWQRVLCDVFGGDRSKFRILAINDGSSDGTAKTLDKLADQNESQLVIHKQNGGHGSAVRVGYESAIELRPRWIFQSDSDDQIAASEFLKLWRTRQRHEMVLGKRLKRSDPLSRKIITKINRMLVSILYRRYIMDANVPFRLMARDFAQEAMLVLPKNVFAPNIFLSIIAAKAKINLAFVDVKHCERKTGEVSIRYLKLLNVCFRTVRELFVYRSRLIDDIEKFNCRTIHKKQYLRASKKRL